MRTHEWWKKPRGTRCDIGMMGDCTGDAEIEVVSSGEAIWCCEPCAEFCIHAFREGCTMTALIDTKQYGKKGTVTQHQYNPRILGCLL